MSIVFVVIVIFVATAALVYYVGQGIVRSQEHADERLVAMRARSDALERTFAERAVAPIFQTVGSWGLRFTPSGWVGRTRHRLVLAGWDDSLDANSWAAIRIFSVAASLVFFFLLPSDLSSLTRIIALILLGVAGFILPEAILNRNIDARREQMRRELPEILDLLVISVEAGLSFDAALARVVQSVPGLMSEEFTRMLQETRVGVSRRDAMENLADRTDLDELQSFLLAMNQADAFGVSVVRVLRVQAEEMRSRRRVRAQEKAFAAPVKMVFPLVLCIFPALFIVLVGPAAVQIQDAIINR